MDRFYDVKIYSIEAELLGGRSLKVWRDKFVVVVPYASLSRRGFEMANHVTPARFVLQKINITSSDVARCLLGSFVITSVSVDVRLSI